ncbi:MAG: YceI family protein [Acidimicrobiia bacterium]|nr:YceI family protein [Acidimicrobiia bacterium]
MSDTTTSPTRTFEGNEIPAPGHYVLDASHTDVAFVARHLMVTKVRGRFSGVEGTVVVAEEPLESSVAVTLATASLDTGDASRDEHVRSADLLDVDQHPTIEFRSTTVRHTGGSSFEVDGELTVAGVTRPVTLDTVIEGVVGDPWGGQRLAVSASAEIDREDFGLTWNVALETGGVLVGKKIRIEIDAQAVRQD